MPVRAHGMVGDDELGAIVREGLGRIDGCDGRSRGHARARDLVLDRRPAARCADRSFWHHTGANDAFDGTTIDPGGARLVHLGYPPLLPGIAADDGAPLAAALERIRTAGATTSLDLAVVDPDSRVGAYDWERVLAAALPHTDILTPSLDDLTSALRIAERPGLADELAERMLAAGAGIVAISSGEDGLLVRAADAGRLADGGPVLRALGPEWAGAHVRVDPVPVAEVGTTNGAGDAASGGLLIGLLRGAPPEAAAGLAVHAAADWIGDSSASGARIAARAPELAAWTRGQ